MTYTRKRFPKPKALNKAAFLTDYILKEHVGFYSGSLANMLMSFNPLGRIHLQVIIAVTATFDSGFTKYHTLELRSGFTHQTTSLSATVLKQTLRSLNRLKKK